MRDLPSHPPAGPADEPAGPADERAGTDEPAASELAPGVRELDHTADVGIEVTAADAPELFRRAARGMARLMRGGETRAGELRPPEPEAPEEQGAPEEPAATEGPGAPEERRLELSADSLDLLLVRWLAELLYLDEVEGFVFEDATFESTSFGAGAPREDEERCLRGIVRGRVEPGVAERQLKGVTYHGLRLDAVADGWRAEVIFDI